MGQISHWFIDINIDEDGGSGSGSGGDDDKRFSVLKPSCSYLFAQLCCY
jgi:hypothetical protein